METQETITKHGRALDKAAAAYFAVLRDYEERGIEPSELDELYEAQQWVETIMLIYRQDGVPGKEIEAMLRRNGLKQ
jgi:hypothetical protein